MVRFHHILLLGFSGSLIGLGAAVLLSGCILDQKGKINQENQPPVINLPPNQEVDTEKLRKGIREDTRQEVLATSTSTAAQMTGAVNASVSKLADKLTGLEANIKAVMENTVNLNAQASAELRAKLEASLQVVTDLRAELKIINEFNTKFEARINADISAIKDLKAQIGQLNTQLNAQLSAMANAQAGLLNKIESTIETTTATAGGDVNFLPKEAVEIMVNRERSFTYIIGAIMGAITLAIGWIGRMARLREKNRTIEEQAERKRTTGLLMTVLGMLPEGQAEKVKEIKAQMPAPTKPDKATMFNLHS